jgi:hypothetical protein
MIEEVKSIPIIWNGEDFLLIGDFSYGAISTRYQYENCEPSTAHLYQDGTIKRYGIVIGNKSEIREKQP